MENLCPVAREILECTGQHPIWIGGRPAGLFFHMRQCDRCWTDDQLEFRTGMEASQARPWWAS
jgi:hypothetical protein